VLLAPYSLAGALTGRSYLESDTKTKKLLEDWRRFYYIPKNSNNSGGSINESGGIGCSNGSGVTEDGSGGAGAAGSSQIPAAVEVIVGEKIFTNFCKYLRLLVELPFVKHNL